MSIGQLKGFYESEGFQTVDRHDNMVLKTAEAPTGKLKGVPTSPHTVKKIVDFQGIIVKIDRPRGFVMSGTDAKGTPWTRRYRHDYGFIPRTKGGDGEGIDVFVGPLKSAKEAYWAVQIKDDGSFDEYKVFLGFPNRDAAVAAYRAHIPRKKMKGMVTMRLEMMKAMLNVDSNGLLKKTASFYMGFHDELEKMSVDLEALKERTPRRILSKRLAEAYHELAEDIREKTREAPSISLRSPVVVGSARG
jgi:hypothetical protein